MSIIDSVKRIEREGDSRGEHCAKLLDAIDELAALLFEAFKGEMFLPRGWKLERSAGGRALLARYRKGGEEPKIEYANGSREDEEDDVTPRWSLKAAHTLSRDVASGWLDVVESQLRGSGCVAAWDARVIQAAVDAMKGDGR